MTSLILRIAARYLFPVILVFSVYALLRGHNEPGGGFVGGLAAASAFILYALAYNVDAARKLLGVDSITLSGCGLLIAMISGILPMFSGKPFLTAIWTQLTLGGDIKLKIGTPLFFDIGVYLVVLGVTATILLALSDNNTEESA